MIQPPAPLVRLAAIAGAALLLVILLVILKPWAGEGAFHQLLSGLPAIPFVVLTGALLTTDQAAKRALDTGSTLAARLRAGPATATLVGFVLFAVGSGSPRASMVAVGSVGLPRLIEAGHRRAAAAGMITVGGPLTVLAPPSLILVTYSVATGVSLAALLLAGLLPTLLLLTVLSTAIGGSRSVKKKPVAPAAALRPPEEVDPRDRGQSVSALWGLGPAVVLMVALASGLTSPAVAAGTAAAAAAGISFGLTRERRLTHVPKLLLDCARTSLSLALVATATVMLSWALRHHGFLDAAATWLGGLALPSWIGLLIATATVLVLSNMIAVNAMLVVVAGVLVPIGTAAGYDPIHQGVVLLLATQIGRAAPPYGMSLFVAAGLAGLSTGLVARASAPWLAILLLVLVALACVPWLTLVVPGIVLGYGA